MFGIIFSENKTVIFPTFLPIFTQNYAVKFLQKRFWRSLMHISLKHNTKGVAEIEIFFQVRLHQLTGPGLYLFPSQYTPLLCHIFDFDKNVHKSD